MQSFNDRAKRKLFPTFMQLNDRFHLNDCVLAVVPGQGATPIRLCKAAGQIPQAFEISLDKRAILLLAQELTGSEENARSFLNSFKVDIDSFDMFFAEDVQNKIVTALGSAYTMMQIGCPERYSDHVLAGGEFGSFADLLVQCFKDINVSNKCPCISTHLHFLAEISKNNQTTARTKALAIEKQFMRFFKDYTHTPVKIGEVSARHLYTKKEEMSPFLSYMIIFFLMNPLSQSKREEIILQLATRLGKAKTDISIEDMLANKSFLHDQINFATGAKQSFSYENWSKTSVKPPQASLRAMRVNRREPRRPPQNRNRTPSRERTPKRGRGRTPTKRVFNAQGAEDMSNWANTVNKTFSPNTRSKMVAMINPKRSRSRDRRRSTSRSRRRSGSFVRNTTQENEEADDEVTRDNEDTDAPSEGKHNHIFTLPNPQSPMFVICPSILIKKTIKYKVIYDTGASSSCIPIQLVRNLHDDVYTWSNEDSPASTIDASGNKIHVLPDLINIDLKTKGNSQIIKIRNGIVADFPNKVVQSQILLGISDIRLNGINLINDPKGSHLTLNGQTLKTIFGAQNTSMLRKTANRKPKTYFPLPHIKPPSFEQISTGLPYVQNTKTLWLDPDHHEQIRIDPEPTATQKATIGEDKIVTEDVISSPSNPDSKLTLRRALDKEYDLSLRTFSHEDIKFDPEGTLNDIWPKELITQRIQQLKEIVMRYKTVFRGDIGEVRDDTFLVRATIDQDSSTLSTNRCRNYYEGLPDAVKKAVLDKFRRELAQRVLVPTSTLGIVPKNILPVFGVPKKGANDEEILLDASKVRLIADCSKGVNKATTHRAASTDDIRFIARKVAKFSKTGFTFSVDVADAFYCFRLALELIPYFCIHHPEFGMCAYTRLPQGWVSSPQNCRDFLHHILTNQNKYLVRYLDDICGGAESWDEFLVVFEGLLKTLAYHNLRLKGSKVTLLGKSLDFLGKKIVDGNIYPNPHTIDKINSHNPEDITTIGQMLSFIGMMSYISDHIFQSSAVLHDLRQACKGNVADHFKWTPELKTSFEKAKEAITRSVVLSAPSTDLPHYLVVDTSKLATGAVLFAKKGDEKLVLGIFSRKRTDVENKTATPSCVAELAGIGAALKYFSPFIADLKNPLTVLTDSKSAAAAYEKFRIMGHPTTNMRLSAFINTAYGLNFRMVYVKNSEPDIKCVDFLSRLIPKSQKECSDCKVCEVAKYISDARPISQSTYHQSLLNIQSSLQTVSFEPQPQWIDPKAMRILHLLTKPRNMISSFPSEHDFWKNRSIHFTQLLPVTRTSSIDQFHGPIEELLRNASIIRAWQQSDKHLREALRCITEKQDPHSAPVSTLLHHHKAYIDDNGILRRDVHIKTSTHRLIILPSNKHIHRNLVDAIHTSKGHSTKTSLQSELKRLFHSVGLEQAIDRKVKACPGCCLLRQPRNIHKTFKSTPIPEHIGEVILVDEIHRTFRSKPYKFLFASDCLSRYSRLYPFEGAMNANLFVEMLIRISEDFLFYKKAPSATLEIRCDHLPAHVKALEDPRLKERAISIEFHDSKSGDGKQIPELDGRMAKTSKILVAYSTSYTDVHTLAWNVADNYNQTRAAEGFSPWELWNRQKMGDKSTFDPPIQLLRDTIAKSRLASRKSVEKAINHRAGPPLNIVPYTPSMKQDYAGGEYSPIKLGDLFLLNMAWDKNNSTPYYIVSKVPEVPEGINFDERLVGARKVGVRSTRANQYYFSFDAIRLILDGNTTEAKDFINKAGNSPPSHRFIRGIFERGYPYKIKPNLDLFHHSITWDDFSHVDEEFDTTGLHSSPHDGDESDDTPTDYPLQSQKNKHRQAKKSTSRTVNFKLKDKGKSPPPEKPKSPERNPSWMAYIPGSSYLQNTGDTLKNLTDNLMTPIYKGPATRSRTRNRDHNM